MTLAVLSAPTAGALNTLHLEHSFNGYYFPYNFPVFQSADSEPYFSDNNVQMDASGRISTVTYNEDYSVRERFDIQVDIPQGYKPASVAFNPYFKLDDGTTFFFASFQSTSLTLGDQGYQILNAYDAETGKLVESLFESTYGCTVFGSVFLINGKPSVILLFTEYDKITASTSYFTKVLSLGAKAPEESSATAVVEPSGAPVATFGINGLPTVVPQSGGVFIQQFENGTTRKVVQ